VTVLTDALDHLVRGIVNHPDDVQVRVRRAQRGRNPHFANRGETLEVLVNPDDLGRVIGRAGRTATASSTAAVSAAGCASASESSFAWAAAAFFAVALRAVTASVLGSSCESFKNSLKIAVLSRFGSATFIGSGAGSPLNFCQSPVTLRIAWTGSLGWAPTPSQYSARSESTSMKLGSSFGWYLPISSITRPSRFVRESATTIR
jgi:predicted RNA-binding protein YlqC (UPF0109 family)